MFEPFEMIRVVNLPERRDRRQEMTRELARVGLENDPRIAFFPAIRPVDRGTFTSIGARGCYESHLAILREAADASKAVLILEDDCDFSAALEKSPNFGDDWQIFYGGYDAVNPDDLQASEVVGSHMMGFTADTAKQIVAYLDQLDCDGIIHPSIDAVYVWFRRAHPRIVTRFAVPVLSGQRSSRSDVADLRFFDRMPGLRFCANMARRFLRKIRK